MSSMFKDWLFFWCVSSAGKVDEIMLSINHMTTGNTAQNASKQLVHHDDNQLCCITGEH